MLEMRREVLARKAAEFVQMRWAFAGTVRSGEGGAYIEARGAQIAASDHVAVRGGVAGTRGGFVGRGDDAGDSCATLGREDGTGCALRQGRGAESDGLV